MDFQPMSPEEMQRAMQFIINHQAQFASDHAKFAADFERLSADHARFAADLEKLSAKTDRIADGVIGLTGLVGRAIDALATAQVRAD